MFLLLAATSATAAQVRIHRAEPFTLPAKALPATGTLAKPHASTRTPLEFDAFGQRFALELQDNAELLARLPAERRKTIAARAQLYAGKLQGQPDSWVRLTRVGHDLHGLIFDGHEFYSIAPVLTLESLLDSDALPVATAGNVIYRASDMEIDLDENFCSAVRKDQREQRSNGAEAYRAILDELATTAAAIGGPTREVEVGLLGDLEFFQRQGASSEDALISRFNIVDGIFTDQVDLRITIGSIRVLTGGANPFTTNDSEDLLDELSAYRRSNAALQAFGLTHLVTGRALDGRTIGIAFVEGVCDQYFGTSLSSDIGFDVTTSALVAAHELGHNFGADHDAEAGSVCATTPDGYLMAPTINGSGTFSDCSLQTMEPVIASATCIFPARIRDAELTLEDAPRATTVRTPHTLSYSVVSAGNTPVEDVELAIAMLGDLPVIDAATSDAGPCTTDTMTIRCALGSIPEQGTRRVTIDLSGRVVGSATFDARVTAARDEVAGNDRQTTTIAFEPRVDLTLRVDSSTPTALVGETITTRLVVAAAGIDGADNVVVGIGGLRDRFTVESAIAETGSCDLTDDVQCSLGSLPANEERTITIRYTAQFAGSTELVATANATYDDVGNGIEFVTWNVLNLPRRAVELTADNTSLEVSPGQQVTLAFTLESIGPQAIADTSLRIIAPSDIEIQGVSAEGTTCEFRSFENWWICEFATLAPGEKRRISVAVLVVGVGFHYLNLLADSPESDFRGNASAQVVLSVLHPVDVQVYSSAWTGYDRREFVGSVTVQSIGREDATNVVLEVQLPDSIAIPGVVDASFECSIQDSLLTCQIGTLAAGQSAIFNVRGRSDIAGQFYGTATVYADDDGDASNDQVTLDVAIAPAIDIALTGPSSLIEGYVDEPFDFVITVEAGTQPVGPTTVNFSLSPGATFDSLDTADGFCSAIDAMCSMADLPASGTATIRARIRSINLGTDSVHVRAQAVGDIDSRNNFTTVLFRLEEAPAPPPPPPPPAPPDAGGSGGGGHVDLMTLILVLGLSVMSAQRRKSRSSHPR